MSNITTSDSVVDKTTSTNQTKKSSTGYFRRHTTSNSGLSPSRSVFASLSKKVSSKFSDLRISE
jgi:hypothetical protein